MEAIKQDDLGTILLLQTTRYKIPCNITACSESLESLSVGYNLITS